MKEAQCGFQFAMPTNMSDPWRLNNVLRGNLMLCWHLLCMKHALKHCGLLCKQNCAWDVVHCPFLHQLCQLLELGGHFSTVKMSHLQSSWPIDSRVVMSPRRVGSWTPDHLLCGLALGCFHPALSCCPKFA